jgi:ligand-binding SRPBCC domain-containing protein
MQFQVTSPAGGEIYPGMIITYLVKPFPFFRTTWVTEITHVKEPDYFVDEQRMGPYKMWHHEHHFTETKEGILMEDIVYYALPVDPLSRLIHPLIHKKLEEIFNFRYTVLETTFSTKSAEEETRDNI